MYMPFRKILLLVLVLLLPTSYIYSEIANTAGTAGGDFLKIVYGARPGAMGEAFTAIANDLNALQWNSAGLVQIKRKSFSATYAMWFEDINYGLISYGQPINKDKVIGASLAYLQYGNMFKTSKLDNYGVPVIDGSFGAADRLFTLGYAQYLKNSIFKNIPNLSVGTNINFIQREIDGKSAVSNAIDVGLLVKPTTKLSVGMSIQHIGSEIKFEKESDPIPLTARVGAAYSIINLSDRDLVLAMDINKSIDNKLRFVSGAEYHINKMFALRAGYRLNCDTDWITAGAGFVFKNMQIDYAYAPFRILGDTHRISLSYYFEPYKEAVKERVLPPTISGVGIKNIDLIINTGNRSYKTNYAIKTDVDNYTGYVNKDGLLGEKEVYQNIITWKDVINVKDLTPNTLYSFSTYAKKRKELTAEFSEAVSTRTYAASPVLVNVDYVSTSSVQMTWDANGNPSGTRYEIDISTDNFVADITSIATVSDNFTKTSSEINDLISITTYYFRVRAYNDFNIPTNYGYTTYTREIRLRAVMINFETDKDIILEDSKPILDVIAQLLRYNPQNVTVEGHTDNMGSQKYNKKLSQKRAESVMRYLIEHGVDAKLIKAIGYGFEKPIANNNTPEGRAKNRRIEFVIETQVEKIKQK